MAKSIPKRAVLTALWWVWGLLLFLLLFLFSLQPRFFGEDVGKVWQWFVPNIVPAMTMVGFTAYNAPPPEAPPSPGLFGMALGVSCFYLAILTISILGTLFAPHPLEFLTTSSYWLGPLQGFATAGLALFFVKK
jgi:hypothetical protein